jgi:hypothetical protein
VKQLSIRKVFKWKKCKLAFLLVVLLSFEGFRVTSISLFTVIIASSSTGIHVLAVTFGVIATVTTVLVTTVLITTVLVITVLIINVLVTMIAALVGIIAPINITFPVAITVCTLISI